MNKPHYEGKQVMDKKATAHNILVILVFAVGQSVVITDEDRKAIYNDDNTVVKITAVTLVLGNLAGAVE